MKIFDKLTARNFELFAAQHYNNPEATDVEEFKEVEWSIDPSEDFKAFALKIVMKSENPAFVPQGQALRAIALV